MPYKAGELVPDLTVRLCDRAQELQWERLGVPLLQETVELQKLDACVEEAITLCQGCDASRLLPNGAALCALVDSDLVEQLRAAKSETLDQVWAY